MVADDEPFLFRARLPFAAGPLFAYLGSRALPGVEEGVEGGFRRTLRLARGTGLLDLRVGVASPSVAARLALDDPRDRRAGLAAARALLDLDADPGAVDVVLGADPLLAPLVARRPGLRVPGHVDGFELAVRAVLHQQISVAGARTLAGRLVAALGVPLERPDGGLSHLFPAPSVVAASELAGLGLTGGRIRALRALASVVAEGTLVLERGADPVEVRRRLMALPGIGPWTASYVALRALGDRDALPAGDLGLRRALERLGRPGDARAVTATAEPWRPFRAYGVLHLWASLGDAPPRPGTVPG